jgi:copper resistance protein C
MEKPAMVIVQRFSRLLLVAAAILFAFAGVRVASAHAHLKSSLPAAGATVAPPDRVVAVFANHDPLVADVSFLKVTDAAGAQVDMGDSMLDPSATGEEAGRVLVVSLKPNLSDGVYTVNWEAGAADAVSTGSFQFTVQAGSAAATMGDAPAEEEHAEAPAVQALPNTGLDDASRNALLLGTGLLVLVAGLNIRRRSNGYR